MQSSLGLHSLAVRLKNRIVKLEGDLERQAKEFTEQRRQWEAYLAQSGDTDAENMAQLKARIEELEDIIKIQDIEIEDLRKVASESAETSSKRKLISELDTDF